MNGIQFYPGSLADLFPFGQLFYPLLFIRNDLVPRSILGNQKTRGETNNNNNKETTATRIRIKHSRNCSGSAVAPARPATAFWYHAACETPIVIRQCKTNRTIFNLNRVLFYMEQNWVSRIRMICVYECNVCTPKITKLYARSRLFYSLQERICLVKEAKYNKKIRKENIW